MAGGAKVTLEGKVTVGAEVTMGAEVVGGAEVTVGQEVLRVINGIQKCREILTNGNQKRTKAMLRTRKSL